MSLADFSYREYKVIMIFGDMQLVHEICLEIGVHKSIFRRSLCPQIKFHNWLNLRVIAVVTFAYF